MPELEAPMVEETAAECTCSGPSCPCASECKCSGPSCPCAFSRAKAKTEPTPLKQRRARTKQQQANLDWLQSLIDERRETEARTRQQMKDNEDAAVWDRNVRYAKTGLQAAAVVEVIGAIMTGRPDFWNGVWVPKLGKK